MSHRNLLARATEGTEAPTPGYLYVDLAKAATGNPGACQEMATYLTRRLASKQNPNIKFKCCKVLSKLCDQVPRNAFRRCVAQDHASVAAVKEAMHFRGTPDPVRGDEPNQKVRIAAKEALDAVYREAPSSEQAAMPQSTYGGVSSDYGGPPHGGGGGGGYGGGGAYNGQPSRMQGIGNPRFSDPRNDPRYNGEQPANGVKAVLRETGEVLAGMIKDPLARNIDVPPPPRQGHSGNLPGYGGPQYGRPPPGQAELSRNTGGEWNMASNRGPGAVQADYGRESHYGGGGAHHSASSGTVGGSWGSAPANSNISSSSVIRPSQQATTSQQNYNMPSGGGTAVSDGTYEKNLVKELCPPGGMKPVPPPDKLANFARTCASLNSDLVCPAMLDCLEDGQPWIIRAKALCAMEAAIANGAKPDGQNPYRDFFYACRDEIAPLTSHPRVPIHEPARRVLSLLGVDSANISSTTTAAAAAAPVAAAPNLLDFDDDPAPAPAAAPPPAPAAAAAPPAAALPGGEGASMFGGMQVKSTPAPAAAAPAPSLLDGWDAPAPAPEPAVAATASMFDQLSVKASGTADDASAAASATDTAANESAASAAPPAGSAFGFMNSGAPAAPGAAAQPPTFDPLKQQHFSPTSAKKAMSMQMSPEQIQAMAYQQMMMQQQMQQMQMAMAMKQGGGMPMFPNIGPGNPPQRMPSGGGMMSPQQQPQFSFNAKPAKKDDKKFDFVMDAMKTAGHKK